MHFASGRRVGAVRGIREEPFARFWVDGRSHGRARNWFSRLLLRKWSRRRLCRRLDRPLKSDGSGRGFFRYGFGWVRRWLRNRRGGCCGKWRCMWGRRGRCRRGRISDGSPGVLGKYLAKVAAEATGIGEHHSVGRGRDRTFQNFVGEEKFDARGRKRPVDLIGFVLHPELYTRRVQGRASSVEFFCGTGR